MAVIDVLMETAVADTDLIRVFDRQGDRLSTPRDVAFLLRAPSADKATLVASFINDYQYGVATAQDLQDSPSVLVMIHMPIEQNAILSVSGFMACICELFGLDYDGWECDVRAAHT